MLLGWTASPNLTSQPTRKLLNRSSGFPVKIQPLPVKLRNLCVCWGSHCWRVHVWPRCLELVSAAGPGTEGSWCSGRSFRAVWTVGSINRSSFSPHLQTFRVFQHVLSLRSSVFRIVYILPKGSRTWEGMNFDSSQMSPEATVFFVDALTLRQI